MSLLRLGQELLEPHSSCDVALSRAHSLVFAHDLADDEPIQIRDEVHVNVMPTGEDRELTKQPNLALHVYHARTRACLHNADSTGEAESNAE